MDAPKTILISRTDSIGDVVLTLPVAYALKQSLPHAYIGFIGKAYTRPVIEACIYIDAFIDVNDFLDNEWQMPERYADCIIHVFPQRAIAVAAKRKGIATRIGTTNRWFHWHTCNQLVRLSRKQSPLHEAQLNLKLLSPLGIRSTPSVETLATWIGLKNILPLSTSARNLLQPDKFQVILHPKSQGSAREWGMEHFIQLVRLLPRHEFQIFISGTAQERTMLGPLFDAVGSLVTDITGTMNLGEFISFINACDGLVANSTGPLHIAAALGKKSIGIYAPMRPIHPGRWAPIGPHADVLVVAKDCNDCRKLPSTCHCIKEISPFEVASLLVEAFRGVKRST